MNTLISITFSTAAYYVPASHRIHVERTINDALIQETYCGAWVIVWNADRQDTIKCGHLLAPLIQPPRSTILPTVILKQWCSTFQSWGPDEWCSHSMPDLVIAQPPQQQIGPAGLPPPSLQIPLSRSLAVQETNCQTVWRTEGHIKLPHRSDVEHRCFKRVKIHFYPH